LKNLYLAWLILGIESLDYQRKPKKGTERVLSFNTYKIMAKLELGESQPLALLEELIKEIYLPILTNSSSQSKITDALRNEFIGSKY
jgi:hypothetical protein